MCEIDKICVFSLFYRESRNLNLARKNQNKRILPKLTKIHFKNELFNGNQFVRHLSTLS